jgi:hypothetical protein
MRAPATDELSGSSSGKDGAVSPFPAMPIGAGCPV